MINRLLIRIKIVQLVYAYLQGGQARYMCEEELLRSLESSYKLYNYLLALIAHITDYRRELIEAARNKYLPTQEERFPNTRFIDNRIASLVRDHSHILNYCEEHGLTNDFDTPVYRALFDEIAKSPVYLAYMSQPQLPTFEQDKELWKTIFNTIIPNSEPLDNALEEKDIYWNDDLTTVNTFVVKTLHKMQADDEMIETAPMFKSEEDKHFATELFRTVIDHAHEYLPMIDRVANNWELDRMAVMDKVVMICAIAEIVAFPDIPVRISLNEYIELSKHYSSFKSAHFVNGILDKIVKELRAEGIPYKN